MQKIHNKVLKVIGYHVNHSLPNASGEKKFFVLFLQVFFKVEMLPNLKDSAQRRSGREKRRVAFASSSLVFLFPFSSWLLPLGTLGLDVNAKTLGLMEKTGGNSQASKPGPNSFIPRFHTRHHAKGRGCRAEKGSPSPTNSQSGGKADQPMGSNHQCELGPPGEELRARVGGWGTQPSVGWCRRATDHNL